jgi:hypothetical protein
MCKVKRGLIFGRNPFHLVPPPSIAVTSVYIQYDLGTKIEMMPWLAYVSAILSVGYFVNRARVGFWRPDHGDVGSASCRHVLGLTMVYMNRETTRNLPIVLEMSCR